MEKWAYLILGGGVGTLSRYLLTGTVHTFLGTGFPYGTMAVNTAGCLMMGFFYALSGTRFALHEDSRILLMTGFCGAFTTVSTFILEATVLARTEQQTLAIIHVAGSLALGFLFFRLGLELGEIF